MQVKDSDEDDIDHSDDVKKKRNTCLIICLITILVLMLPSTLAFLAIF
jgi:hypothetical protein